MTASPAAPHVPSTIRTAAPFGSTCQAFAYYAPAAHPVCGRPATLLVTYADAWGQVHQIAQCPEHVTHR